ncbi:hypothetical protein OHA84_32725 [Streptomyces sp. NBC_00513]|uniref:hypothetical protein n=1 Tax=unclassified Streptomyces TaxID=2593676 RepID=UPI002259FD11|nr:MULTISPECIES: hypothetical protein [unclassified Streptomyces]MCX5071715.1 hypothetical protein [Streptomyces sp. NBC_00424]MCX5157432.1 hypothetical protein [Streptomyces sp. NBC_00291]WUD44900.1 hypothetical protein OHA84_32725 [Streptomyces sp. NBC_00513]
MRTVRALTAVALAGGALLGLAGTAAADTPSPSPSASSGGGPTEAGTSFRTATAVKVGQEATADASTGDYLYWVLPLDAGQRATVKATVTLPAAASRHGAASWRLDVYDGLRRRQPCMYGKQAAPAAKDAGAVELSCTLRPVRTGADTWANDPLPGAYYVRLTVIDLAPEDLGQPVRARVRADATDTGGAYAVDGALSAPLVPGITAARAAEADGKQPAAGIEPEGGWAGGRWSDRWIWTVAGGLLAALAGIGGYSLTRGSGRPARTPSGG